MTEEEIVELILKAESRGGWVDCSCECCLKPGKGYLESLEDGEVRLGIPHWICPDCIAKARGMGTMKPYKPDYEFLFCEDCGGTIGMFDRSDFTCERCGMEYQLYRLKYDRLKINDKTGWIFPVRDRRV